MANSFWVWQVSAANFPRSTRGMTLAGRPALTRTLMLPIFTLGWAEALRAGLLRCSPLLVYTSQTQYLSHHDITWDWSGSIVTLQSAALSLTGTHSLWPTGRIWSLSKKLFQGYLKLELFWRPTSGGSSVKWLWFWDSGPDGGVHSPSFHPAVSSTVRLEGPTCRYPSPLKWSVRGVRAAAMKRSKRLWSSTLVNVFSYNTLTSRKASITKTVYCMSRKLCSFTLFHEHFGDYFTKCKREDKRSPAFRNMLIILVCSSRLSQSYTGRWPSMRSRADCDSSDMWKDTHKHTDTHTPTHTDTHTPDATRRGVTVTHVLNISK